MFIYYVTTLAKKVDWKSFTWLHCAPYDLYGRPAPVPQSNGTNIRYYLCNYFPLQVCDLKLQEVKSLTVDIKKPSNQSVFTLPPENATVLNDDVLKSCLGSSIHLTTSEELKIQGQNPLRPLRDALKNSISLLMESSSSNVGYVM